jgi:hypothetical protein
MKNLNDLLAAARRTQPPAATPEARADFARTTVAAWQRAPTRTAAVESGLLWLRAGFCSITAAAAVVIALAVLHPAPTRTAQNPFDLVLGAAESDPDPLF